MTTSVEKSDRCLLVGLTGGMGAGKTTVAGMFRNLGATIVDADQIAREVVAPGQPALRHVAERFGEQYLTATGSLDRARMAALVFNDPHALRDLEGILHPAIAAASRQRFAELCRQGIRLIIYEASQLIEAQRGDEMDCVVVVVAQEEERVRRLLARGSNEADARRRMAAQLDPDDAVQIADFVIENSGDLNETRRQVGDVWLKLEGWGRSPSH